MKQMKFEVWEQIGGKGVLETIGTEAQLKEIL